MREYLNSLTKNAKIIRLLLLILLEAFAIFSVIYFSLTGDASQIFLAVANIFISLLPFLFEIWFKTKLSLPLHLFFTVYIAGLLLGHSYHFYDYLPFWDSMLHAFGGFTIALIGSYLLYFLNKKQEVSKLVSVIFAISLALALSVLWEFVEYSCDHLIGSDMQKDTVITTIRSYFLGSKIGEIGTIENISTVTVNGETLPVAGYLDIGLIDTLTDLLMALIGSVVVSIYLLLISDKYPLIQPQQKKESV